MRIKRTQKIYLKVIAESFPDLRKEQKPIFRRHRSHLIQSTEEGPHSYMGHAKWQKVEIKR